MIIKCSSSLRIFSETLNAQQITDLLNCKPSRSYNKGDPISKKSDTGATRQASMWLYLSECEGDDCVENCFLKLLTIIKQTQHHLKTNDKIITDVTTGVFSDNEQLNFFVPHEVSALLGQLELDHLISGYIS